MIHLRRSTDRAFDLRAPSDTEPPELDYEHNPTFHTIAGHRAIYVFPRGMNDRARTEWLGAHCR